ncbi:MAG: DedA family protein [Geminicoccaceae bacterium]|nr:DedA family protein [Geminicoccaceae bacterium]HRY24471.1 DedA family protein [Geminicoccaceae bacterium]
MADWISGLVESGGYLAIVALVFLENVFPPIPSELILPLAGSVAGRGGISLVGAVVAATIGSVAGALGWYWVGWWLGLERLKSWAAKHGRWITLSPEEIERADAWFDRHSGKSVLIGRLIPTIRTLISVPAGISGMTLRRFLLFSTLGTAAWSALLIGAGYLLGEQYESVGNWLNPVSNLVAAGLGLWYAYRVLTFDRRLRSS